jgi:serine phosphatase RsbU (regulator of sigma subunit)
MHRSILTAEHSQVPVTVYATGKQGRRIPMQVSVAPIIDGQGEVLGAVEVFRDLTHSINDMTRARLIQNNAMSQELPSDARVEFAVHCVPMDIVGGDFYRIERIENDRFCFMLADVMGHGMAGALYTMQIRSLWEEFRSLLGEPASFMTALNRHLYPLIHDSKSFASALYGVLDLRAGTIGLVRAGHPSPFVFRADGSPMRFERGAVALGLMPQFEYTAEVMPVETGDCFFAFTDGAFEVENKAGEELGIEGLERMLLQAGYPRSAILHKEIEERLLAWCHELYLPDDLTFLEFRLR